MDAKELLGQARDAMTVRRVFGDPIERDGTLILPVASVMGGAGGGGGPVPTSVEGAAGAGPMTGEGYGFGMAARPLGVYVIRDDTVEWRPAVDRNRQLLLGAFVSVISILAVRAILLTIARR